MGTRVHLPNKGVQCMRLQHYSLLRVRGVSQRQQTTIMVIVRPFQMALADLQTHCLTADHMEPFPTSDLECSPSAICDRQDLPPRRLCLGLLSHCDPPSLHIKA